MMISHTTIVYSRYILIEWLRREEKDKKTFGERAKLDLQSKVVDGEFHVDQGVIAGCSGGTFDNVVAAADILEGKSTGIETSRK
jgi:aconitate hydratase